jgi:hypothetical protein
MTASETFGWKCIGEYFGKSTDSLFLEYAKLLFSEGIDAIVDECKKDPLTKENIIDAKAAFEYDLGESFKVLPKSIVFYKECPNGETVFDAEKYKGTVYFIAK